MEWKEENDGEIHSFIHHKYDKIIAKKCNSILIFLDKKIF